MTKQFSFSQIFCQVINHNVFVKRIQINSTLIFSFSFCIGFDLVFGHFQICNVKQIFITATLMYLLILLSYCPLRIKNYKKNFFIWNKIQLNILRVFILANICSFVRYIRIYIIFYYKFLIKLKRSFRKKKEIKLALNYFFCSI